MINIKKLNKLTTTNDYFMSMQKDIIELMKKCEYINLINDLTFFLQFLIVVQNRHNFFFITHREKKQLNVVVMRFKNFFSYVQ